MGRRSSAMVPLGAQRPLGQQQLHHLRTPLGLSFVGVPYMSTYGLRITRTSTAEQPKQSWKLKQRSLGFASGLPLLPAVVACRKEALGSGPVGMLLLANPDQPAPEFSSRGLLPWKASSNRCLRCTKPFETPQVAGPAKMLGCSQEYQNK